MNPPVVTEQHIQAYMVNPPMTSEQHIQTYVSRCTHDSDPTCSSMGGTLLHSIPSPTLLPPPAVLFPPSAEVMPCACSASPAPHDRSGYISMRNDVTMVSSTLNRVQPGAMSRALARTRRMSMSVPDMTSPPPSPMALYPSHVTHSKSRSRPRLAATMNPPYRRNRFEDFPRSFFPEMSDEDSTAEDDDGDAPRYLSASENCSRYVRDTSVRIHEGEVIYSASRSDVRKSLGAQSDDYMPMTSTLTPQPRQQQQHHQHKHQRQPSQSQSLSFKPLPQPPPKQRVTLVPLQAPPMCRPTKFGHAYVNLPGNIKSRSSQEADTPWKQRAGAGVTSAESSAGVPRSSAMSKTGTLCRA